jgi:hypothetical protein
MWRHVSTQRFIIRPIIEPYWTSSKSAHLWYPKKFTKVGERKYMYVGIIIIIAFTLKYIYVFFKMCSNWQYSLKGRSAGIATYYGLDGPGIKSQWGTCFALVLRGPPSLLYQVSPPGVKRFWSLSLCIVLCVLCCSMHCLFCIVLCTVCV